MWDIAGMAIHFVSGRAQDAFRLFGLPTVVVSAILLGGILLLAEGMFLALGAASRPAGQRRPRPARPWRRVSQRR